MVDGNSHKQSTIELIGSLARSGLPNLAAILPKIEATEILLSAVAADEDNAAARHIHALKTSCGNVGGDCLDHAWQLAKAGRQGFGRINPYPN